MAQLMPLPLTVSCFSKMQIGFTFLVPAHPGSLGQRAIKQVCVCVCVTVCNYYQPASTSQQQQQWRQCTTVRTTVHDNLFTSTYTHSHSDPVCTCYLWSNTLAAIVCTSSQCANTVKLARHSMQCAAQTIRHPLTAISDVVMQKQKLRRGHGCRRRFSRTVIRLLLFLLHFLDSSAFLLLGHWRDSTQSRLAIRLYTYHAHSLTYLLRHGSEETSIVCNTLFHGRQPQVPTCTLLNTMLQFFYTLCEHRRNDLSSQMLSKYMSYNNNDRLTAFDPGQPG